MLSGERRARGPPLGLCPPGHQVSPPVGAAALGGPRETDRPHNWGRSPHPSGLRPAPLPFLAFGHFPLTGGIGLLQGGREGQAPPLRNLRMLSYFGLGRRKLPGWAADSRPYRTYKRLSGEYRRGRSQTGPPSMGKFPGYGGRGTPQGGLSRPSADSPSASALRDSKKRIQSRNRSALSHRAKLCQTARRGRRALRQNRNRPWFAVGAAALGGPRVFTALFCKKRQISS